MKDISKMIQAVASVIESNAVEVTELDQAIGDGDHVINLQRGLEALVSQGDELDALDWVAAMQKIGMTLMSTVGGASGSLLGTLFVTLSKAGRDRALDMQSFSNAFSQGVEAVKLRGKAQAGEKTMLDVLIPVAETLLQSSQNKLSLSETLANVRQVALEGVESTRNMIATKGRASYQGEHSLGHIDAGAKTCQLMICTIADQLEA